MRVSYRFLAAAVALAVVLTGAQSAAAVDWSGDALPARVKERRISVDGLGTRLLETGPRRAREAVVFMHGFPGSALDFVDLMGVAGRSGRALAFDFPGFGEADKPPGHDYSVANQARFIEAALDKLEVKRVHLVLHDFGGFYGLEWASLHVDRLRSITLIDAGILPGYLGHKVAMINAAPGAGEAFNAIQTRESFGKGLNDNNPKPLPVSFIDRMYEDYDNGTRRTAPQLYRAIGTDLFTMPGRQGRALGPSTIPALVIWGAEDPYIPARYAARQRDVFTRAEVHVLPEVGHFPFADEVARTRRLVGPFLRDALPGRERD